MNLKPLGDRLIVEVLEEEEQTFSGIVLPDTAKEKPQRGRVLAVGPGSRDDNGKYVPLDVVEKGRDRLLQVRGNGDQGRHGGVPDPARVRRAREGRRGRQVGQDPRRRKVVVPSF